jgi:hypothetical protein
MGKFCTSCGSVLNEGAKFCAKCGANAFPIPEGNGTRPNHAAQSRETVQSKGGEEIKIKAKIKATAYVKSISSSATPTYQMAGELTLPQELIPDIGGFTRESLPALLKSGFIGLASGFKQTLQDKKRLSIVIALALAWLVVNILIAFAIFPVPVRVLSWLTAAQGSLIGGSIGKGLVAVLFAQIITNEGMFSSVKEGIDKMTSATKGEKKAPGMLMIGMGIALIVCNLMVSSNFHNTMVCIAGFALSAKSLTQNGFLRRLTSKLLPKEKDITITTVMGGWTLGFAVFAAISFLPGLRNGYWFGIVLLVVGGIWIAANKNKKEEHIQ